MKSVRTRRNRLYLLILFGLLLSLAWGVGASAQSTIHVTTADDTVADDGFCSVREAVMAANQDAASGSQPGECEAGSGADVIEIPAGTYPLDRNGSDGPSDDDDDECDDDDDECFPLGHRGDLDVAGDLTIEGIGRVVIQADPTFTDRLLHVHSGNVQIENITLEGANTNSNGAGIFNAGSLTIIGSTISGNTTSGTGGGIRNSGTLSVANSTLSGNSAAGDGGGFYNRTGTASFNNVTITNNVADSNSDGGNGGGIRRYRGTVNVGNSIIAGNFDLSSSTVRPDCSGQISSLGYNIIGDASGCNISGDTTGNQTGVDPLLGPLADNGGNTFTHALLSGSPAIDSGNTATCETSDQRGDSRPSGLACDIGAYEKENNPPVAVDDSDTTNEDVLVSINAAANDSDPDGNLDPTTANIACAGCSSPSNGSLLNSGDGTFDYTPNPNFYGEDSFIYEICDTLNACSTATVTVTVNPINDPPLAVDDVDYSTDEDVGLNIPAPGVLENDSDVDVGDTLIASPASGPSNGSLTLNTDGSFTYSSDTDFNGSDSFTYVANDGTADSNVAMVTITINSVLDPIAPPSLIRVIGIEEGESGTTVVNGLVPGFPNALFTLIVYAQSDDPTNPTFVPCDESITAGAPNETVLNVQTDSGGYFSTPLASSIPLGDFVVAAVVSSGGDKSPDSQCVTVGLGNDSWPNALTIPTNGSIGASHFINNPGQSRWYKFDVQPDSQLTITLTNLPGNYDITLYTDIQAAFESLRENDQANLLQLGAEIAQDAFAASALSPDAFTPDAFTPDAFTPDAFTPDAFTPDAFTPDAFTPDAFTPDAFTPDAFTPDAFTPDAFTPDAFTPDAFTPDAFTPDAFTPDAFTSAQSRSLIGISAFEGTVSEGLRVNTWNNDGDYYVRVRGRNGAFDATSAFDLSVQQATGGCSAVNPASLPSSNPTVVGSGWTTLFIADWGRMERFGPDPKLSDLQTLLFNTFEAPSTGENAVVIDVGQDGRVSAANQLADNNRGCPFAKNLVAESIQSVIDAYRAVSPDLKYVVLLGNDDVIPFYRYPDTALLGNESNYIPPVKDDTHSQASLRLGYVLSQDAYGSDLVLGLKDHTLPIAQLPVGRLVETAADMMAVIDAYDDTGGIIVPDDPSLVTGYDFLTDSSNKVLSELNLGTNKGSDSLITGREFSPEAPESWSADELKAQLIDGVRHDIIYLAGHFSANTALAADYSTRLLTSDLADAPPDHFKNSIIFSAGCHAGYNIVDADGFPLITREPDWAQAFAQQGATLIAGTGYQYGDTDFIEYSERLYVEFSRQLRATGAVSVGDALVKAKQLYLAGTPMMRGIHEKAYLESTLFGLPMLRVDMQGAPLSGGTGPSIVTTTDIDTHGSDPGTTLGLEFADVTISASGVSQKKVTVEEPVTGPPPTPPPVTHDAFFYEGSTGGVIANPGEPILPSEIHNVSSPTGKILRGVGFRGATYNDSPSLLPLTSAAATEIRGVHTPFQTDIFYPSRPWSVNYFGALSTTGGPTYLTLSPVQVISDENNPLNVHFRVMSNLNFRLFYSAYDTSSEANGYIAEADAPAIVEVDSDATGAVQIRVNGNPAAGVQNVWITYTGESGDLNGSWASIDLTQSGSDSTLWTGQIPLGNNTPSIDTRFFVQAVNGVGMVSMSTNQGAYYTPGLTGEPTVPTALSITSNPGSGAYSTKATFTAQLTGVTPLEGNRISFVLGPVARQGTTDSNGFASATLPLLAPPGTYDIRAAYGGSNTFFASSDDSPFTIQKRDTTLALTFDTENQVVEAELKDVGGVALSEKTILFVVTDGVGGTTAEAVITDYAGRANINVLALQHGNNSIAATFAKPVSVPGSGTVTLFDVRYNPSDATIQILVNQPPDCTNEITAVPNFLWSPDKKMYSIQVLDNGSDPDGDAVTVEITGVFQDEVLTRKFDARWPNTNPPQLDTVEIRAARDGGGDGRVYHIFATLTDPFLASCDTAFARVAIDHDNSNIDAIDQGPLYDSFTGDPFTGP